MRHYGALMAYEEIQRERAAAELHAAYLSAFKLVFGDDAVDVPAEMIDLLGAVHVVGKQLDADAQWPTPWPQG